MDKKIILISGGSEGLGKAIAARLAPNHQVIILSRNPEKLQTVSSEIGSDFVQADVTDFSSLKDAVEKIISKYNRIDVLVNNAGVWVEGQLDENDPEKIKEVISVNTLGTIFLTKAVLPHMKLAHSGRIVNIVSQDGLVSKKDHSVYSASKWAITGFSKCLLEDLSHLGIAVTAINPGLLKTNLFEKQGVNRNLANALDPSEVASIVEYVINLSPDTLLPDISIKNINNPTTMDDTSAPIGLDINPDMITPQTGIPQAAPNLTPATTPTTGVIDITPGGGGESHAPKTEDITPAGPAPSPEPTTSTPAPSSDVVDITPDTAPPATPETTPAVSTEATGIEDTRDSASHLSEIIPGTQPTVEPTPAATTELSTPPSPESVAPAVVTPTEAPTVLGTPATPVAVTTEIAAPAVQETTQVELPPAVENPLAEDPDTVKLVK